MWNCAKCSAEVEDNFLVCQPLRLRRVDDGVVIYSVGLDGKDDDGRASAEPGTADAPASPDDIAIRLLDLERRLKATAP